MSYRDVRWQDDAACSGMDTNLFYPPDYKDGRGKTKRPPIEVLEACMRCPVTDHCLNEAVSRDDPYGVWGGTTARQRKLYRPAERSELHKARIGESVRLTARRKKLERKCD